MREKNYRICLNVSLGTRSGTMVFHESGGKVDGWLNVMNQKNRFFGAISKEGQLTLTSVIHTLISIITIQPQVQSAGEKSY